MLTTIIVVLLVIAFLAVYGFVAILRDLDRYYNRHQNRW